MNVMRDMFFGNSEAVLNPAIMTGEVVRVESDDAVEQRIAKRFFAVRKLTSLARMR